MTREMKKYRTGEGHASARVETWVRVVGNRMIGLALALLCAACTATQIPVTMNPDSVPPGGSVTKGGEPLVLLGDPIMVGERLPATALVDAQTMQPVNLAEQQGAVLFLSIVPSLDTKVCEAQTHYLAEQGDTLPEGVRRITISRDTPFAQKRFAEEAGLEDVQYLSDYKMGEFGRSMGLLVDGPMLLARSVILADRQGVVRYIQVVPELTHLPDMERAFARAAEMARQE